MEEAPGRIDRYGPRKRRAYREKDGGGSLERDKYRKGHREKGGERERAW